MRKIENILCVVDPTALEQPALLRAVRLSVQFGAKLDLLICDYNQVLASNRLFDSRSMKEARIEIIGQHEKRLQELADENSVTDLIISVSAIWDHPLHEGIVRHASATGADMVFKDTHQHAGFGLSALSNSDWSLIRTCPVPLWLVKPGKLPEPARIIAAIDPTNEHDKPAELDNTILHLSNIVAKALDGEVHAFHSVDTRFANVPRSPGIYVPTFFDSTELRTAMLQHHRSRFDEIARQNEITDDRTHLVEGATHETLPVLATEISAGLVVMGAVARSQLKRIFIGATAEFTLGRLPCDLLVVKPPSFETPVQIKHDSIE